MDQGEGRAWKVQRIQTSRGLGSRSAEEPVEDLIGLTMWCEDLDQPGRFVFTPDEAEKTALAILDSVAEYRNGEL